MGNCSSTSNCNPCGPDFSAINQLATKAGAYARQANTYSVDAQNAATNAQEIVDQGIADIAAQIEGFEEKYLGAKNSDPTTDNQGDPLQVGALYWNTVSNELKVWNGASWTVSNFNEFSNYTATGTTFARNLVTRSSDIVNAKDFGAVGDGIVDDTAALQAAVAAACSSLKSLYIPKGNYKVSQTLVITAPIKIYGDGISQWSGFFNELAATQLSFVGTGAKTYQNYGVTNMEVCGGFAPNLSARAGYNETNYSLLDFMNGANPRDFSIGILVNSSGVEISDLRLVPSGGGADHLAFYNNSAATGTEDWSDGNNWDVGILLNAREDCYFNRIQSVGHWRISGMFVSSTGIGPADARSPYRTIVANSYFQGYKAAAIRGSDKFRIIGKGPGYVDVPYAANHPFVSAVFSTIRWSIGTSFSTQFLGVTSTSVVGGNLRIFCTADTAPIVVSQDSVVVKAFGGGNSHIHFTNCFFMGMEHPSRFVAHRQRIGTDGLSFAYNHPSGCLEMSGHRGTEAIFEKCAFQTIEEDIVHIHDHNRTTMEMCAFECSAPRNGARRARIITSPQESLNTRVPNPCGSTFIIKIDGSLYSINDVDFRPAVPQSVSDLDYTGVGDNGLFSANIINVPFSTNFDAFIRPRRNETTGLKNFGFPTSASKFFYDSLLDRNISATGLYIGSIVQIQNARIWDGVSWSNIALQSGREMVLAIPDQNVLELQLSSLAPALLLNVASNNAALPKGIFFCRPRSVEFIQTYGTAINAADLTTFAGQDLSVTPGTAGDLNISVIEKVISGSPTACIQLENRIGGTPTFSVTIN
jgi:hypothetical protein